MAGDAETARSVLHPLHCESIVLIVIATVFLFARCLGRFVIKRLDFGADDAFLFASYVIVVGMCGIGFKMANIEGESNGLADSDFMNPPQQVQQYLEPVLKCIFAIAQLLYYGFTLPKLSLLASYLRIFSANTAARRLRQAIWIMIGITSAACIAFSLVQLFACLPIHHFYTPLSPGKCININAFYRSIMGINFCIDLAVLLLPLHALWKLQAPVLKKLGLTAIIWTNALGTIMSAVRFVMFLQNTAVIIKPIYTAHLIPWVIAEPFAYFVGCCLLGCGPLFNSMKDFIIGKRGVFILTSSTYQRSAARREHGGVGGRRNLATRSVAHGSKAIDQGAWYKLRRHNDCIGVQTDVVVSQSEPSPTLPSTSTTSKETNLHQSDTPRV